MTREGVVHVVGAGGHGKVVIATLRAAGFTVGSVWDDDESQIGARVLGVPVRGSVEALPRGSRVVVAIGSNNARRGVVRRLGDFEFITVVHPSATVHPSVVVGRGSVILAAAVVQPDTKIGEQVIVNTAASVDHDCVLEDLVHVAPGVSLAGNVTLREGAFLGIGACVLPGVEVGEWTTVGAGAVAIVSIPAGVTAIGCPARVCKRVPVQS